MPRCSAFALPLLALAPAPATAQAVSTVTVHVPGLPPSLNLALDSTSVGRQIHEEVHETLLELDPESLELVSELCSSWRVEDVVHLAPEPRASVPVALQATSTDGVVVVGIASEDDGEVVVSAGDVRATFPTSDVERVERGTAFTFELRDDARWHDGHPLDARDVLFSWQLYANPEVRCDARRFFYQRIVAGEALGPREVRFLYDEQYFKASDALASLCLLPSHLYDLTDPDHPRHDPDASEAERAREINDNAHNRDWIGLGRLRVTRFDERELRARRVELAPPLFDEVAWRALTSDTVTVAALVEGQIDFTDRLEVDDVERVEAEGFTTGHFHRGRYGFVAWNMRRPKLADVRVRRALAHAFDFDAFNRAIYDGRAVRVTGPQNPRGPGYAPDVEPLAFDLSLAEDLFLEAGWIDRDGDGRLDLDGTAFSVELLIPAGNRPAQLVGQVLQEALARIGAELVLVERDVAALLDRVRSRDFDAVLLAWTQPLESDPEQKWHSRWADAVGSSNLPGLADERVDELIDAGQVELDDVARAALWRQLHRRLHALQPYLFLYNSPVVYGLAPEIGGFATTPLPPNYRVGDWTRRR